MQCVWKQLDRVCNPTHHVEGEAEYGRYTGQCRPGTEPVECTPRQECTCGGADGARAVEPRYEGSRPPRLLNDGVDEEGNDVGLPWTGHEDAQRADGGDDPPIVEGEPGIPGFCCWRLNEG